MRVPRKACRIVLSLLLLSCLAACGGAQADAQRTLRYWDLVDPSMAGDPRSAALRQSIAEFEKANPGVKVEVETLPWPQISPMLLQASAAKKAPDVVRVLSWDLPKHVAAGDLVPLDQYADAEYRKDWLLGWDTLKFDGRKMAIPFEYRSPAMYLRTDYLKGDPPRQWADLVAEAHRHRNQTPYGLSLGFGRAAMATGLTEPLVSYLADAGLKVFNPDGTIGFDNPRGYQVFDRLADLVRTGAVPRTNLTYQYEDVYQSVKAGSSALAFLGTHRANAVRADSGLSPDRLRTLPLPNMFGKEDAAPAHVSGWTLAVPTDAHNPALSWKFIEYMTRASTQARQVRMTGELPTRASPYQDKWFSSAEGREKKQWADWFQHNGVQVDYGEHWSQFGQLCSDTITLMVLRGTSAEDAVHSLAAKYNELVR